MWYADTRDRVWLYRRPTDMRCSFEGLSAVVKRELGEEPSNGDLYVFVNRRKTLIKVLYFERGGYCVWSKRLEQGQYHVRFEGTGKTLIDRTVLALIIEGIDTAAVRRFKRYRGPSETRRLISHPV